MELGHGNQRQISNSQSKLQVNAKVPHSADDNMVASIASKTLQIKQKNTILQIGNTKVGILIDSLVS